MFEAVIRALIALCLIVAAAFLILWVLAKLGLALPPMIVNIFWVIVVLVAILILYRLFSPYIGKWLP